MSRQTINPKVFFLHKHSFSSCILCLVFSANGVINGFNSFSVMQGSARVSGCQSHVSII